MFRETDPGVSPLLSLGVRVREHASLRDAPFGLLEEDHEHARRRGRHDGEGGEFTTVDEVALGQDLAEDHVQHGAALLFNEVMKAPIVFCREACSVACSVASRTLGRGRSRG